MNRAAIKITCVCAAVILAAGCAGNGVPSDCGVKISTDLPAGHWAAVLSDSLAPERAAESTVAWLCGADAGQRSYARQLVQGVAERYNRAGGGEMSERYTRAIDSVAETLPDTVFARVLTTVATPRQLGAKVKTDADSARLVKLIKQQYKTDAAALQEFGLALD